MDVPLFIITLRLYIYLIIRFLDWFTRGFSLSITNGLHRKKCKISMGYRLPEPVGPDQPQVLPVVHSNFNIYHLDLENPLAQPSNSYFNVV